ncbi:MAG: transcription antitermination protein NusB [Bacteroidales bacterium]|nr:transcription antitermination protein NusB [Bacteroidales bacterium]
MLNRRILRIKAFKAIYSYAENPGMSLKETEALLDRSCESTRDLYLFLLSIVQPLTDEARARIEAARSKFRPTEEELHPNTRFIENTIAPLLSNDIDFQKLVAKRKLSWEQYDMLLRHLYEKIRGRQYFKDYLESEQTGIEADARLWARIFEREFEDNDELEAILEDLSIYWNDDISYALGWCCRSMREIAETGRWEFPALYQSELKGKESLDSDHAFVVGLVRKAYANFDNYYRAVAEITPKWDKDRICTTDLCLIVCGLAESEAFPEIPVKVIINEYVEISKYYSTPDSRSFVNGILDKLINKH